MVDPKAGDEVVIDGVTWIYLEQPKSWGKYQGFGLTEDRASGKELTDILTEWGKLHPEPPVRRVKKLVKEPPRRVQKIVKRPQTDATGLKNYDLPENQFGVNMADKKDESQKQKVNIISSEDKDEVTIEKDGKTIHIVDDGTNDEVHITPAPRPAPLPPQPKKQDEDQDPLDSILDGEKSPSPKPRAPPLHPGPVGPAPLPRPTPAPAPSVPEKIEISKDAYFTVAKYRNPTTKEVIEVKYTVVNGIPVDEKGQPLSEVRELVEGKKTKIDLPHLVEKWTQEIAETQKPSEPAPTPAPEKDLEDKTKDVTPAGPEEKAKGDEQHPTYRAVPTNQEREGNKVFNLKKDGTLVGSFYIIGNDVYRFKNGKEAILTAEETNAITEAVAKYNAKHSKETETDISVTPPSAPAPKPGDLEEKVETEDNGEQEDAPIYTNKEHEFANLALDWYQEKNLKEKTKLSGELIDLYVNNQDQIKTGWLGLGLEKYFIKYLPEFQGVLTKGDVSVGDLRSKVYSLIKAYKQPSSKGPRPMMAPRGPPLRQEIVKDSEEYLPNDEEIKLVPDDSEE